ncbi:MAG: type II toxin-antitoxin system VapC family toxin [Patescibacteria group bacterium]|nr:type II toxin-antitoxin system VapC family toxin [Patescibacteria group bacterium]
MIFLDTSFLLACFNNRDVHHYKAIRILHNVAEKKHGAVFMTDYIFNETVTVSMIKMKDLGIVKWIGNYLLSSLKLIRIEEDIFFDSWKIFQSQKGTRLGFTDCTTIATMRYNGIDTIATFDKDFTKINDINCIGL